MGDLAIIYGLVGCGVVWELGRYSERGFLACMYFGLSWPYQLGRCIGQFLNRESAPTAKRRT